MEFGIRLMDTNAGLVSNCEPNGECDSFENPDLAGALAKSTGLPPNVFGYRMNRNPKRSRQESGQVYHLRPATNQDQVRGAAARVAFQNVLVGSLYLRCHVF